MKEQEKSVSVNIEQTNHTEDNATYNVTLKVPISYGWVDSPFFISNNTLYSLKFNQIEDDQIVFNGKITLVTQALYRYFLSFKGNGQIFNVTKNGTKQSLAEDDYFKMSVNYQVPDWAKGKVMYHVFVDRFKKGRKEELSVLPRRNIHKSWEEEVQLGPDKDGIWNNDFYGGDLQGIISELDYIQSLGTTILYLSPIAYSQSTHRYDTSDYEEIDPYAGSKDDLKMLCQEAHKRGMKVILDGVFNHTGNDSKYFNEYQTFDSNGAYQNLNSPYLNFYQYQIENEKPVFDYWWGMKNLPVCNGDSLTWQQYITGENGIIDQWFQLGIDGLRLDVADELSDHYIELIRKAVHRNKKDGFILGEVWKNPMRMNRGYLSSGKGLDSIMNYNLDSSLIRYLRDNNSEDLKNKLEELIREYPDDALYSMMNFTSTQDITRGINIWDQEIFQQYGEWPWNLQNEDFDFIRNYKLGDKKEEAMNKYQAYLFSLIFLPGIFSIFYADEIGLEGVGNLNNRKPYPWGQITKEQEELRDYFRYLGQIRKQESFLEQATLIPHHIDQNSFSFERTNDQEGMFIAINRTNQPAPLTIPEEYQDTPKIYTLKKSNKNLLAPYGGIALKKSSK